jgi:hypothetical protein
MGGCWRLHPHSGVRNIPLTAQYNATTNDTRLNGKKALASRDLSKIQLGKSRNLKYERIIKSLHMSLSSVCVRIWVFLLRVFF